jgi:HSP20 family protein
VIPIIAFYDHYDVITKFLIVACKKMQMQNNFLNTPNPSVYPGEYVPLFSENDLKKTIKHSTKNKTSNLPVNIKELVDFYKIELAVPGVKRENLLLTSCGNVLSLSVIHNELNPGLDYNRKIILPDNAEPIFVSAEYKRGILHLYIPKSSHPLKWINKKIAIY